ncbi:uncharacterized protein [Tenebrio molitor]|uniref:uncharacterized protein isoform X2 n=1 Tax=Tenebrio molitor TaxID=7067 RepID=UPI003624A176
MALVLFSDSFKFGIVIASVAILSSCLGAPTSTNPWWYNACNTDIRLRHSRSTNDPLAKVKDQLRTFVSSLQQSAKNINMLYKQKVTNANVPYGKIKWLKMKKMLKDMKNARPNMMLPEFYKSIQYFAGTLDRLLGVSIKSNVAHIRQIQQERLRIYNNITYRMRALVCEVQDNFQTYDMPIPPGISLEEMNIDLPKELTLTGAHILDLNFFKKATSFFRKAQKHLKQKKRKSVKKKSNTVKHKKRT